MHNNNPNTLLRCIASAARLGILVALPMTILGLPPLYLVKSQPLASVLSTLGGTAGIVIAYLIAQSDWGHRFIFGKGE
jgi:hypothetical protein